MHERFDDLDAWRPLTFPDIQQHSTYKTVPLDGDKVLKTKSADSASALVLKKTFNVHKFPVVTWRWKVNKVYKQGNAEKKSGDDYPIRVYIIFKYDPSDAGLVQKAKYAMAKKLHGEYPPDSSLNYIWANREHDQRIITNAYTSRAKLIVLRTGTKRAGQWVKERVHVLKDYRKAFGEKPPAKASIAIMNDSDNTDAGSVSYIDDIRVQSAKGDEK